ncbi:PREDICTED: peroxisomal NADH pyrophosphatase NUDT12-like [Thamnophis sirtalis]|uniref:Peroxisomal NADH pyrophosphatase NUDT12-like n=1 Tax=Thamnophis sirtalis TaxID=35019 RepID=A0A6I9XYZ2_9SAUR|nr:PREDICTED: peroxisomal NADH pyrophosphatase NUDT12-like [Thamnophis sirtalis]
MEIMEDSEGNPKKQLVSELHQLAADGNKARLTALLDRSPSLINETARNGWTALMYATRNGHFDVVQVLLDKRCDRFRTNTSNQTALDIARFWGYKNIANLLANVEGGLEPFFFTYQVKEPEHYFCRTFLDRKSEKRVDSEWLSMKQKEPTTIYIIFSHLNPLVTSDDDERGFQYPKVKLCKFFYKDIKRYLEQTKTITTIFMGVEPQRINAKDLNTGKEDENGLITWFALRIDATAADSFLQEHPGCYFLHPPMPGLLQLSENEADPVVIMQVIHPEGNHCLLGRKKRFPPGMFTCLAGFIEPAKSLKDGSTRLSRDQVLKDARTNNSSQEEEEPDRWARRRKWFKNSKRHPSARKYSKNSSFTKGSMNSERGCPLDLGPHRESEERGFYTEMFHSASWMFQGDDANADNNLRCLSKRPVTDKYQLMPTEH